MNKDCAKIMQMAFNYKLLYFRIKKPDLYSSLNIKPLVQEFLEDYAINLDPGQNPTAKTMKSALGELKKKMIHHIRILMLAFLSPLGIRINVFEFLQKLIDFFPFGFIVEEIFEYLMLYIHSFDTKTKYMLFNFINKILLKFTKQNYLYVYERLKSQDENSLLYLIDGYYNKEAMAKFLIGYTHMSMDGISKSVKNHFYNYILSYNSRKFKYECINVISKFLRKSISVVLFDIENLDPFDKNVRTLCNLSIEEIKNMPLNTFISVSKLFISILEIKITLDKKDIGKQGLVADPIETFSAPFINFCIHYFSQKSHLASKHQTIYSIRDINIHKRLIDNLVMIYTKLKKMLYEYKNFPDKIQLYSCENNTYFTYKCWNVVKGNKNFNHKQTFAYQNYPDILADLSDSKAVMKAILWFIKQKTDLLRSLLYKEFKTIKIDIFNDSITIQSKDISIINELFKINPSTSCMFIQR